MPGFATAEERQQTPAAINESADKAMDLVIVRQEELDPATFLELVEADPTAVKSAHIHPPRLGSPGFGKIVVEYTVPRLRKR